MLQELYSMPVLAQGAAQVILCDGTMQKTCGRTSIVAWLSLRALQTGGILWLCRDDVNHKGEKIDWGKWAITGNDPDFNGTGNPDTGDDYGPAPGRHTEMLSDST